MAQKLTGDARKKALAKLPGWTEVKGRDAISRNSTLLPCGLTRKIASPAPANRPASDHPGSGA